MANSFVVLHRATQEAAPDLAPEGRPSIAQGASPRCTTQLHIGLGRP